MKNQSMATALSSREMAPDSMATAMPNSDEKQSPFSRRQQISTLRDLGSLIKTFETYEPKSLLEQEETNGR